MIAQRRVGVGELDEGLPGEGLDDAAGDTVTLGLFAAVLISSSTHASPIAGLATDIAAGDLATAWQAMLYTEALQTTLLGIAARCALLGATAARLTRPPTTESNAMTLAARETAVLRYTVAPQFLEQHLELLRAVYTELDARRPPHFSWANLPNRRLPRLHRSRRGDRPARRRAVSAGSGLRSPARVTARRPRSARALP